MTVIAAIARDGQVVMVGDRQAGYCGSPRYGIRKIRRHGFTNDRGEFLLAVAGSGGPLALLTAELQVHSGPSGADPAQDVWAEAVARAVTQVLAESTPPELDHSGGESHITSTLLLGHAGRLWYLQTNVAHPVPDGIASIGSGSDIAMGAMHVALDLALDPDDAATRAVVLACRFDNDCGVTVDAPMQVEHLEPAESP